MTRYAPLWAQGATYPAVTDRKLPGAIWTAGGTTGMAVAVQGGTMNALVALGRAVVPDGTGNAAGAYLCVSDAQETVTLDQASSQDRIDLIIVRVRDAAPNNDWIADKVTGTPSANPSAPAVPASSLALAQIRVVAGSAFLSSGNLTDRRVGLSDLSGIGTRLATAEAKIAALEARSDVYGSAYNNANQTIPQNAWTTVVYNTLGAGSSGLVAATGIYTCPSAGTYLVVGVNMHAAVAGGLVRISVFQGTADRVHGTTAIRQAAGSIRLVVAAILRCAAGDQLTVRSHNDVVSGVTLQGNQQGTRMDVFKLADL